MVKDYNDTLAEACGFLSECTAVIEVPDRVTWAISEREREERLCATREALPTYPASGNVRHQFTPTCLHFVRSFPIQSWRLLYITRDLALAHSSGLSFCIDQFLHPVALQPLLSVSQLLLHAPQSFSSPHLYNYDQGRDSQSLDQLH